MLLSTAISFVRARLDEIAFNNDDMILAAQDDRNLDTTIERLLPGAVKVVVLSAPAHLLEPESFITKTHVVGAVDVEIPSDFLRMVYMKSSESDVFVFAAYPFSGTEARMQENPYTMGQPSAPVVIQRPTNGEGVVLTYHTMLRRGNLELAYIKSPVLAEGEVFCPALLTDASLYELTAQVLETYSEDNRAQVFRQKSANYLAQ